MARESSRFFDLDVTKVGSAPRLYFAVAGYNLASITIEADGGTLDSAELTIRKSNQRGGMAVDLPGEEPMVIDAPGIYTLDGWQDCDYLVIDCTAPAEAPNTVYGLLVLKHLEQ